MGLTGNGKALCYINNFGNGTNSIGSTDYPYIVLDVMESDDSNVTVRRSCLDPIYTGSYDYSSTNYKNIIDTLTIIPMGNVDGSSGDYDYDYFKYQGSPILIDISESCVNKNTDISDYSKPVVLQATKTIKHNNTGSLNNNYIMRKIQLRAKNYKGMYDNNWVNTNKSVVLADIDIDPVTLSPGDIASFTIVIG